MKIENQYFFLKRDILFNKRGESRAIYDFGTGDVIAIDRDIGSILELSEIGKTVEEISTILGKPFLKVTDILNNLEKCNFGGYTSSRIYVEKVKLARPYYLRSLTIPEFTNCYVELSGSCSQDCSFCGLPTMFQCNTCRDICEVTEISGIISFLDRLIRAHCKSIVIHGSDPVSNFEQLKYVIRYCREKQFNGLIFTITNGSLINENHADFFSKYGVQLIVPVFFTDNKPRQDHLIKLSELMKRYNVPISITKVTIESEPLDFKELNDTILKMSPRNYLSSTIYDMEAMSENRSYHRLVNMIPKVSEHLYYSMKRHHPCLFGTIAISSGGNVLPCPYMVTDILGNTNDSDWLSKLFETESIYDYWDLSLSQIEKCQDCAFQNACMDCRAFETGISGDLYGKQVCSLQEKSAIITGFNVE